MGASYGSLLASKILFGGHKLHLVCLPAEADLINAEGFACGCRCRGRKDPVELDSRKLPGKVTAGPAAGVNPKDYDLGRPCHAGAAISLARRARTPRRGWQNRACRACRSLNMPPLPYVKRIPGLDYDALKPAYTDASVWDSFDPATITLNSPDPQGDSPAGREGQRAHGHAADQLQGGALRQRESTAILRQLQDEIEAIRFDTPEGQGRTAGQAQGLRFDLRAARQVVDAARRQLSLRDQGRHRTAQEAVHSDIETSRSVYNFVFDLCVKLGAKPEDLVPFEKYAPPCSR